MFHLGLCVDRVANRIAKKLLSDLFIERRTNASAVLRVLYSVRPSVTRVLCDKTKERNADMLIP